MWRVALAILASLPSSPPNPEAVVTARALLDALGLQAVEPEKKQNLNFGKMRLKLGEYGEAVALQRNGDLCSVTFVHGPARRLKPFTTHLEAQNFAIGLLAKLRPGETWTPDVTEHPAHHVHQPEDWIVSLRLARAMGRPVRDKQVTISLAMSPQMGQPTHIRFQPFQVTNLADSLGRSGALRLAAKTPIGKGQKIASASAALTTDLRVNAKQSPGVLLLRWSWLLKFANRSEVVLDGLTGTVLSAVDGSAMGRLLAGLRIDPNFPLAVSTGVPDRYRLNVRPQMGRAFVDLRTGAPLSACMSEDQIGRLRAINAGRPSPSKEEIARACSRVVAATRPGNERWEALEHKNDAQPRRYQLTRLRGSPVRFGPTLEAVYSPSARAVTQVVLPGALRVATMKDNLGLERAQRLATDYEFPLKWETPTGWTRKRGRIKTIKRALGILEHTQAPVAETRLGAIYAVTFETAGASIEIDARDGKVIWFYPGRRGGKNLTWRSGFKG
jgi:hypothetical protein